MNIFDLKTLRNIALVIIGISFFLGVRYIGSVIHYGCYPERIVNVPGGDDCAPPFVGVGELGFYLTGGSLNPLFNRDAITVRRINWQIERAGASVTNQAGLSLDEQKIVVDVTTYDGKTEHYNLGNAYECTATTTSELQNHTIVIGWVQCNFAKSDITFAAFKAKDGFYIERYYKSVESDKTSTTTLVKIK